jgi:hypothetical protein
MVIKIWKDTAENFEVNGEPIILGIAPHFGVEASSHVINRGIDTKEAPRCEDPNGDHNVNLCKVILKLTPWYMFLSWPPKGPNVQAPPNLLFLPDLRRPIEPPPPTPFPLFFNV